VVALCADISVVNEQARLNDGHTRLGVAAGDHSCLIWPILCGMAKAKLFLLTGRFITGAEAERIGLVSAAVPVEQVLPRAMEIAEEIARGPQHAIRFTKEALNHWLGKASFDYSCALEMLTFTDKTEVREGINSLKEKRPPQFPSSKL